MPKKNKLVSAAIAAGFVVVTGGTLLGVKAYNSNIQKCEGDPDSCPGFREDDRDVIMWPMGGGWLFYKQEP